MNPTIAAAMAGWWTERLQVGDKVKFRDALFSGLIAGSAKSTSGMIAVKTDYDPDAILLESLRLAGVKCQGYMLSCEGILPMKSATVLWADGRLVAKEGYGAPWITLIPATRMEKVS